MRWKAKPIKPTPELGDKRVLKRFAWLPTRVGEEYFWLEPYHVVQELKNSMAFQKYVAGGIKVRQWVDIKLVESFWLILPAQLIGHRIQEINREVLRNEDPITPRWLGNRTKEIYKQEYEGKFGKIDLSSIWK